VSSPVGSLGRMKVSSREGDVSVVGRGVDVLQGMWSSRFAMMLDDVGGAWRRL
jgi:hypothetical protein